MNSGIGLEPQPRLTAVLPTPARTRTGSLQLPCQTTEDDLWFAEAPAQLELAKRLCASCPIRVQCLAGALQREEAWGVWGGEIVERGAVIPFKRPPGRPRKAAC